MPFSTLFALALGATQSPRLFEVPRSAGELPVSYFGDEPAATSMALTAWNGFFDSGSFVARGARPAPDDEPRGRWVLHVAVARPPREAGQRGDRPAAFRGGVQRFPLRDLDPGTTYYDRAFVSHEDGESWSFDTGSFRTDGR